MFAKKKQPAIKSLIAHGCRIEGNYLFADGLRIDGDVIGDIRSQDGAPSILVISETASVKGTIHADHVIINGRVDGPVHATDLLELQPKAQIQGDIHYRALEMHQGAMISGQLRPMNGVTLEEKPTLMLAANAG